MQNDPRLPFSPLTLSLGALDDALQRVHARARGTPHAAAAPRVGRAADTEPSLAAESQDERLLDGAELLRTAREPIEWLLTLAHRLAGGDPEEVAAIDRLRSAFHARLAGRTVGVRMRDVLIAFALLVGALDPSVVVDGVARTVADGVATVLTYEGFALATQLARIAERVPGAVVHHVCGSLPRRPRTPPTSL
jgi:hypothetical protein